MVANDHLSISLSLPHTTYSRCLEHDGQLFSIQLVPHPEPPSCYSAADNNAAPALAAATAPTTTKNGSASAACELENRGLDFSGQAAAVTPPQRWFGLKQYVLLRALGETGTAGMDVDKLLWAMTVASGNCKSSVPVLVSCDWDGLDTEGSGGDGGKEMGSGSSCKGYSAPGSKGVACSVRFQTAWTEKVGGGGGGGVRVCMDFRAMTGGMDMSERAIVLEN